MPSLTLKDLESLLDVARWWNDISSIVTIICCVGVRLSCSLTPRWSRTTVDADTFDSYDFSHISGAFKWSSILAFTSAILTGIDVICIMKLKKFQSKFKDMDAFVDSVLMLLTFIFLGSFYGLMTITEWSFVHIDELAFGGPRPVFTVRYAQWCCCVPCLMCVGARQMKRVDVTETVNELLRSPTGREPRGFIWNELLQGLQTAMVDSPLASSIRLTVIYIFCSWLALVVQDEFSRWLLICVGFSDYLIASLQEVILLLIRREERRRAPVYPTSLQEKSSTFASNLSCLQIGIFAMHGVIYLLAALGLISAPLEQYLYGGADVGAKLLHSIVLGATWKYHQVKDKVYLIDSAVTLAADLKRLIEDANVPIFSVNRKLEVDAWNRKITELTGYSSAETMGKPLNTVAVADASAPTWSSSSMVLILDALEGKCSNTTEMRFRQYRTDKAESETSGSVSMAFSATPVRNAYGEITGAVCMGQDVTELTRQRQEAQAGAAGLSRLVDEAAVPMFEVNSEMRIVEWNSWLVRKLGMSKDQTLGIKVDSLLSSGCAQEVLSHLSAAMKGGQKGMPRSEGGWSGGIPRDGSDCFEVSFEKFQLHLLMNAVPRTDHRGKTVSLVCVGQDVTRLKDVEDWKGSMMAMISHELKSPLHGIIGLSHSLLEDVNIPATARTALMMVNNSAKKLLDIVSGLMDTSRLLHSRDLVCNAADPVDLVHIIEDVVLLNRQSVDKRGMPCLRPGVTLVNEVKPPLPMIGGDAYRLTQLFYNLVGNALKFTHQGTVIVSSVPDELEKVVTIYVKDTGVGIAPENLERIFLPFDQAGLKSSTSFLSLQNSNGISLSLPLSILVGMSTLLV